MKRGGTNCTISVPQYGYARVRATRVTFGMSVVAYAPQGQSRTGAAFYPSKRTSGSFELTLVFARYSGYKRVAEWLERYGRWVSAPGTPAAPCRVTIPSRKFDMTGALEGGITFGAKVDEVTYEMTLNFVGSRDPLEMKKSNLSVFSLGRNPRLDPALPYFYPAGTQLKGTVSGWDTVYDAPAGGADDPEGVFDRHRASKPTV